MTVVIKRVLADRQAEDGPATPATGPDGEPSHPMAPDRDQRRLGWFVAAIAITAVVVVLTVTLTSPFETRGERRNLQGHSCCGSRSNRHFRHLPN